MAAVADAEQREEEAKVRRMGTTDGYGDTHCRL